MSTSTDLLFHFDHEMTTTRRVLERVPGSAAPWKPHPKSMSMGQLASHIANMVRWTPSTVTDAELDFMSPTAGKLRDPAFESTARLVEVFDDNVKIARTAIASATDEALEQTWTLRAGEKRIFTMPRKAVVRSFILSHIIHHRGQLSVYLRLNDVPVPPIYGPTADEAPAR
jgi:uncharacterized damage-inducible protein DinB